VLSSDRLQVDPPVHERGTPGSAGSFEQANRSPARLSARREAAILVRRQATLEGPHRIAWALGEAPATVHRVLRRLGAPRLRDLDRPTRTVVRYERERPGELVHVDVKKQGRIPGKGGGSTAGIDGLGPEGFEVRATTSSTPRSMIVPALPTPRSSPTKGRRLPRRSWSEPLASSPTEASSSSGCSPTTVRAIALCPSRGCSTRPASATDGPVLTGPKPTARWNASISPSNGSGPTPGPMDRTNHGPKPSSAGSTPTTTIPPHMAHAGRPAIAVVNNVPRKHT